MEIEGKKKIYLKKYCFLVRYARNSLVLTKYKMPHPRMQALIGSRLLVREPGGTLLIDGKLCMALFLYVLIPPVFPYSF